jgi:phage gpG-like protein
VSGSYRYEVVDPGNRLRRFKGALDDSRWILTGIGALLESASMRAFRDEKMGDVKWKTRQETGMVPNWPAIVGHFATKGGAPAPRNFSAKETLTATGRLRGSLKSRVINEDTVQIGTNVPYGEALHLGEDTQTPEITAGLQKRLWNWMKQRVGHGKNAKARHRNEKNRLLSKTKVAKVKERAGDHAIAARDNRMARALATLEGYEGILANIPGHSGALKKKANARRRVNSARKAFLKSHRAEGRKLRKLDEGDSHKYIRKALEAHAQISGQISAAKKKAGQELRAAVKAELGPSPRIIKAKQDAEIVGRLRWLLNPKLRGQKLTISHPARPFVGLPDDIREEIKERYGVRVRRVG